MLGSNRLANYYTYLAQWLELALDLVYPRESGCALCGRKDCDCTAQVMSRYRSKLCCNRCGKFMAQPGLCQDCITRGPGFPDLVRALAPYEGPVRDTLHRFKYQGDKRSGSYLAQLLSAGPGNSVARPDLIVPIPLHRQKLRQRGYNQAQLLAKPLALALSVPLRPDALQRVTNTQPQADLSKRERLANLTQAFQLGSADLAGKHVLLVDDILTTGATLEACGNVLREAGVAGLQAVCVAAGREGNRHN